MFIDFFLKQWYNNKAVFLTVYYTKGEVFMTISELIPILREEAAKKDFSNHDFMAVQVTITGENAGVFYSEIKDGKISIEPYDYHDRQCELVISMDNFIKLLKGKLDPVAAFTVGKLKVNGDLGKALEFSKILK